eukprot:TRINITY_DN2156_c0_g2_i1.p1 TRINITY_DN2156_c0_g2~~TRINITY_DN2156_c0_g2_i1.p1  ORF type:complete len:723 (-),score=106.56 TRINITY_DN2156_c0_g2_i1:532-2700(-)
MIYRVELQRVSHVPLLSTTGSAVFAFGGISIGGVIVSAYLVNREIVRRKGASNLECDVIGVLSGQWSLCHWLAYHGWATSLRLLLRLTMKASSWSCANAMCTENRWTPLHLASTQGYTSIVAALIDGGACLDDADARANTSLSMAIARGHIATARLLLDARASPNVQDAEKGTPLHIAASRGGAELVSLLLESNAALNAQDSRGRTPLLVACAHEDRWPATQRLLEAQSDVAAAVFTTKLSSLMLVADWNMHGAAATTALLNRSADPAAVDNFGQTALHFACRRGRADVVAALCAKGAPAAAQDNDGQYPLQLLCHVCARAPEDRELVEVAMAALLRADPAIARHLDFSDTNALQILLFLASLEKTAPIAAVKFLVAAHADPTLEDESGFTAVHYAVSTSNKEHAEVMLATLRESQLAMPEFWAAIDLEKKRDTSNRKYLMRRGGHHRIPLEDRQALLRGDVSLAGVARRIAQGKSRRIVALIGAGASTAAGIPDFRSPSGLWSQAATRNLFSLEGFMAQPDVFWREKAKLFLNRKPTKAHSLLAHFAREGLLQRVYTQNIDGLEKAAGVPSDLIVSCHGDLGHSVCSASPRHVVDSGRTLANIAAEVEATGRAPCCTCGAPLRPDIVFFGEPLPASFAFHSGADLQSCDLLIVMGTALSVYPVSGLVSRVQPLTPRLLLNREAVGVWRGCESKEENYRDAFWEGSCDEGAEEIARLLGWSL